MLTWMDKSVGVVEKLQFYGGSSAGVTPRSFSRDLRGTADEQPRQGVNEVETKKVNVAGVGGGGKSGELKGAKDLKKAEKCGTTKNERKLRSLPPERPRA